MAHLRKTRDRVLREEPTEEELHAAVQKVRTEGALALVKLAPKNSFSKRGLARFYEALALQGLERTLTVLRVPLREQLLTALSSGLPRPLTSLPKLLRGATTVERHDAVERALTAGEAHLVPHAGRLHLVGGAEGVASTAELDAVVELEHELASLLRVLRSKKRGVRATLLRSQLEALLQPLRLTLPSTPTPSLLLRAAVKKQRTPGEALLSVPDLVRAMAPLPVSEARAALLRADAEGWLELRAHSSLEPLRSEDAVLCPEGAGGVPLSYVRIAREPEGKE